MTVNLFHRGRSSRELVCVPGHDLDISDMAIKAIPRMLWTRKTQKVVFFPLELPKGSVTVESTFVSDEYSDKGICPVHPVVLGLAIKAGLPASVENVSVIWSYTEGGRLRYGRMIRVCSHGQPKISVNLGYTWVSGISGVATIWCAGIGRR